MTAGLCGVEADVGTGVAREKVGVIGGGGRIRAVHDGLC